MAELAYAPDLGSGARKGMGVRVPLLAPPAQSLLSISLEESALQVEKTEISPVEVELVVRVPAEDMAERVEEALRRIAPKVEVPGFRRGHVPRKILWQRFGEAIKADAVEKSLQEYYRAALEEAHIDPLIPGTMEDVSFKAGEPLVFKVKLEKAPNFDLPDFSDLSVELDQPQVAEEDVLAAIDALREQQAVLTPTDEPVDEDSVLIADIQELDPTGLPIIGRAQRDVEIDMRRNPLGKDFADQVSGAKEGARIRITLGAANRPEPEQSTVTVEVVVKSVRRKELPTFDDDFAASVNPDAPTAEALREDLRRHLAARAAESARRKMHNRLVDSLLRKVDFPIPPKMLDDYLERLVQDATGAEDGDNSKDDAKIAELKEEYRAHGIRSVRWFLLREKLVSAHDLRATEQDLEREFEMLAKVSGKPLGEVKSIYAAKEKRQDVLSAITDRKVFNFLERQMKVIPVPVDLATFEGRGPSRIVAPS